jgi:hypothetical protein
MNLPMGKEASPGREDYRDYAWPADIVDQIEALDPAERQAVMDELADRTELWGEEVGVCL